jgi:hypothetical protein
MFSNVKQIVAAGALMLAAGIASTVASAQDANRTFTVYNESHYRIDHLYVSPSSSSRWGYDQLGEYDLPTDYHVNVPVDPGWYDVKVVDQDGDSCVIKDVDFRNGDSWTITNGILLACELFTGE